MSMFGRMPFGVDPFSGASSQSVDCCCLRGGTGGPCCGCTSIPLQYTFSLANIGNGTCDINCVGYNGTWKIVLDVPTCVWTDTEGPSVRSQGPCSTINATGVTLLCDATHFLLTFAEDVTRVVYRKTRATWSCLGINILDLFSDDATCITFPATLTLTPV